MGLTDTTFELLVVTLAVAAPFGVLAVWQRLRGNAWARAAQRWGLLLLAQLLAVVAVGVVVNDAFDLYSSWHDLTGLGTADTVAGPPVVSSPVGPGRGASATVPTAAPAVPDGAGFTPEAGGYLGANVSGAVSGVTAPVYVWLPPQYHDPKYAHVRFPVVELFSGFPGAPTTWFHAMDVVRRAEQAMALGAPPSVLVVPTINVAAPEDTECTDLPGGPKVATFLAVDVPSMMETHFRVATERSSWSLMGYSTGGFCATKLALQFPARYHAAVSLAGYAVASSSVFTGRPVLVRANSPKWLIRRRPAPAVSLLLVASKEDPGTVADARGLAASAAPPTSVTIRVTVGGHNTGVWSAQVPAAFRWIGQHSPATPTPAG